MENKEFTDAEIAMIVRYIQSYKEDHVTLNPYDVIEVLRTYLPILCEAIGK